MGGFFGTISTQPCITDLYYGTDYNSHLGTKRGGLCTFSARKGLNPQYNFSGTTSSNDFVTARVITGGVSVKF